MIMRGAGHEGRSIYDVRVACSGERRTDSIAIQRHDNESHVSIITLQGNLALKGYKKM
jgi:hypothetical protein